jgi:Sulfotransferase family
MGNERYGPLVSRNEKLVPELFREDKFFDIQPGESPSSELGGAKHRYEIAHRRFEAAVWVGDKIPTLYLKYDNIDAEMPGAHIIFILRNIIDVAGSYQRRAETGTWTADRDYKRAVEEWRQSIELTMAFIAKSSSCHIHIVSYEELFLQVADLRPLFDKLDLRIVPNLTARYRILTDQSVQLEAEREKSLDPAKRNYIALNAPFDAFREIFGRRLPLPVL